MLKSEELLFSVDENNKPIEPQLRKLSHETGIWHRTTQVWLINSRQEVLCHQRSLLKGSNPGKWTPYFGGHLAPGQEYAESAVIELAEELGLVVPEADLILFMENKHVPVTEFQAIFVIQRDLNADTVQFEEDEILQVGWRSLQELEQCLVEEESNGWTHMGYERTLIPWLKEKF